MISIFPGSKAKREIEEVIESALTQDPSMIPLTLAETLYKNSSKLSDSFLLKVMDDLSKFTFIGGLCLLYHMLRAASESKISMIREKSPLIYRMLLEMHSAEDSSVQAYFLQHLSNDSSIAVTGYNSSLINSLLYSRSKIKVVYALEGYPLNPGKKLASELRKAGMDSYHIPDDYVYWVLKRVDVAIIPVYGISGKGWLTTDSGGVLLGYTARWAGVKTVGITIPLAPCTPPKGALKPSRVLLERRIGKERRRLRFNAYEHVSPDILDYVVTNIGVLKMDSGESIIDAAKARVADTVATIKRILEV